MNRRTFLAALATVPFLGRWVPAYQATLITLPRLLAARDALLGGRQWYTAPLNAHLTHNVALGPDLEFDGKPYAIGAASAPVVWDEGETWTPRDLTACVARALADLDQNMLKGSAPVTPGSTIWVSSIYRYALGKVHETTPGTFRVFFYTVYATTPGHSNG